MHKNEAIAQVAEKAMMQIFDIAQFAISRICEDEVPLIELMTQTSFSEVAARANANEIKESLDALKHETAALQAETEKQKRKPRVPKVSEPTQTTEIVPEDTKSAEAFSENESDPFAGITIGDPEDANESPPIEGTTAVLEHDDNSEFPDHPDAWFAEDLERAKNECRALLAKMMAKAGPNETRKNLTDTTGKSRATDFDADDCMKFYRAFRNNV